MKSKIFAISLLALFLVGIVSAVSFSVSPSSLNFVPNTNSTQFTIANTNTSTLLNVNVPAQVQITGEDGYIASFNLAGNGNNINASSARTITITPSSSIDFSKFNLENTYSVNINLSEQGNSTNTQIVNLALKNSFCEAGDVGDLRVDYDITNKGSLGSDDEFYQFEEIEVEVTIENRGNDRINDVIVSWGLYNKRTGEFIIDDEESKVDVKDDNDEVVTFTFKIDPNDFEEADSTDDFVLYVKAYSDDEGENNQCNFKSTSVTIPRDDDFVVLDSDINFPAEVQCSETVQSSIDAWNIGDNAEDNVYVIISNKELGLNKRLEAGDLDILENKKMSFEFDIPKNATEKSYPLEFKVYNEDDEIFENDNNDESVLRQNLVVKGGCEVKKSVDLSTSLDSDAVAGKELTIKSTLRNTGSTDTTYQMIVVGYDSWATLQNVEPRTLTLKAGESKDVTITLIPNKGTTGDKDFTVQALYNGLITEQKITVPIKESPGFSLTGLSIGNIGGSWFIWVVAALNIILVVLIIVIAVRIARK